MAGNGMTPQYDAGYSDVEDQRWRKNRFGMGHSGQNITLVIDDAVKAEGDHRIGRWLKSGVPIYRDSEGRAHLFTVQAKADGEKIAGLLQDAVEVKSRYGEFYDTRSAVGIQTAGEVYYQWLPVEVDPDDLPVLINASVL